MSLSSPSVRALQNVVLPCGADASDGSPQLDAVLSLYVERGPRRQGVAGRTRYRAEARERVSFAAYFNAFPAAYWRHWTAVESVTLWAEVSGPAVVELWRSDAQGGSAKVAARETPGGGPVEITAELGDFDDGGWLWFEVEAGDAPVEIASAQWLRADDGAASSGTASLGITTYNRVGSCLGVLRQIGGDPDLLQLVDRVYVVDQGEDRISAAPGFAAATKGLEGRLTVIEQANLGGSGGFARCQLETLEGGRSDHLVILDDDIVVEPESIRRAVVFADHCRVPTLVGAQMFSLPEPTRLYAMAEEVDLRRFFWGPKREDLAGHDLAVSGLRSTAWLHRREDVNYNGWWTCLIPRRVLETVGLSLPFFIRWDDAEYGLRAGSAGFPTVTLPGVGVWHVPWTHKTDALDWQAYFHQRNRVVSALLHSPHRRGGLLLPELLLHQVKHVAAMQYSTAHLRLLAMADVLDGPQRLHAQLATKPAQARAARAGFDDADQRPSADAFPAPSRTGASGRRTPRWRAALLGLARQARAPKPESRRTPQVHLRAGEAHWSELLKYDSAVVSAADGSGATWYRRDRAMFADLVRLSLVMHWRMLRAWPRLTAHYRDTLADVASPAAWHDTFESVRRVGTE